MVVLTAPSTTVTAADLAAADGKGVKRNGAAEDEGPASRRERERIMEALKRNGYNLTLTYQQLGMSRTTLWRKLKRYGITLTRSVDAPEAASSQDAS